MGQNDSGTATQTPQTPDISDVLTSSDFRALPPLEKHKFLTAAMPEYAGLPPQEQTKFLTHVQYPDATPTEKEGFWGAIGNDIVGAVKGIRSSMERPYTEAAAGYQHGGVKEAAARGINAVLDPTDTAGRLESIPAADAQRKAEGRSGGYRLAAAAGTATGVMDPSAQEAAANAGDVKGTAGHTVVPTVQALAPFALHAFGEAVPESIKGGIKRPLEAIQGGPRAAGTEDVFRSLQPGGGKPFNLRDNLEVALPDVKKVFNDETPLSGRGGIAKPDFRLRRFAEGLNDRLSEMYQTERADKVARNGSAQLSLQGMDQATLQDTAKWLNKTLPRGTAADVAGRIAADPNASMSLAESDELARVVNTEMRKYSGMTPQEQAASRVTSRRIDGMQQLDRGLTKNMGDELRRRGETDLTNYERRYAAVSDLRDAARSQMESAEAARLTDRLGFYINPRNWFSAHQRIAGAPTTGRLLERGLGRLDRAGIPPPPDTTAPATTPLPALPGPGGTSPTSWDPSMGTQAQSGPGGPRSSVPPFAMGEGFNPGPLARIPGRSYRTLTPIEGGTATPTPSPFSNEERGSIPFADTQAGMRAKLQAVIDSPDSTQLQKSKAANDMRKLKGTTTGAGRRGVPAPPPQ